MKKLLAGVLLTVLALPLLGASACNLDPGTKGLLEAIAKAWAADNGLLNADGSPTTKAIGSTIENGLSDFLGLGSDQETETALDAGEVALNIKYSEEKAAAAQKAAAAKNYPEAKKNLNAAIKKRPHDYSYRNQLAVLAAETGDENAEQMSDDVVNHITGDVNNRTIDAMYRDRSRYLNQSIKRQGGGTQVHCTSFSELSLAYYALATSPNSSAAEEAQYRAESDRANAQTVAGNCKPP